MYTAVEYIFMAIELNALVTSRNRPGFVYNQRLQLQPSRIPTQPETNLIGLQLTNLTPPSAQAKKEDVFRNQKQSHLFHN